MVVMYVTGNLTTFHTDQLAERMTQLGAPLSEGEPVVVAGNDGATELVQLMFRSRPGLNVQPAQNATGETLHPG
jgi:hypothetical protein